MTACPFCDLPIDDTHRCPEMVAYELSGAWDGTQDPAAEGSSTVSVVWSVETQTIIRWVFKENNHMKVIDD